MSSGKLVNASLIEAIRRKYPVITDEELEGVVNKLQQITADHLSRGEQLAFVRQNSDGSYDLTVYGLEILDKPKRKKKK